MRYSLLTQIALIGISIVVVLTVAKPMFSDIKNVQDEIFIYKDAVDKAQQFNSRLQELIAIRDSFSSEDMVRLDRLLPTKIDIPKTMRDFETIFSLQQLTLSSLKAVTSTGQSPAAEAVYDENGELVASADIPLSSQDFEVKFTGSYENLKDVLTAAELNETLVEVTSLKFGRHVEVIDLSKPASADKDAEQFDFSIVFRAYGLATVAEVTQ